MAKVIVRRKDHYPLAYFLYATATFMNGQRVKPGGQPFTKNSFAERKFLFAGSTIEMSVAAAIFTDDPLKIVVFDMSILDDLKRVLRKFKSEEIVVIEIQ